MKIISITIIKNEADIIESFIRYHLNVVDLMIILDGGSSDDTLNILNQLEKESLPLIILKEPLTYSEQQEKYNYLLDIALNQYDADIICPLDCDEFIFCENKNPKNILDDLSLDSFYKIKQRTFVPLPNDNDKIKFIPSKITHILDENLENNTKIILTKNLVKKFNVKLGIENNDIVVNDNYKNKIKFVYDSELKLAHYPIRSVNQTLYKLLNNNILNNSEKTFPNNTKGYSITFNKILNLNPEINFNKPIFNKNIISNYAKQNSIDLDNVDSKCLDEKLIKIKKSPINLNFCENIEIKYSFSDKYLNLLKDHILLKENIETTIAESAILNTKSLNEKNNAKLKEENKYLKNQCTKLNENNIKLKQEKKQLTKRINEITEEQEELIKRNSILTRTKVKQYEVIENLKMENEKQRNLIEKLDKKTFKVFLKELFNR